MLRGSVERLKRLGFVRHGTQALAKPVQIRGMPAHSKPSRTSDPESTHAQMLSLSVNRSLHLSLSLALSPSLSLSLYLSHTRSHTHSHTHTLTLTHTRTHTHTHTVTLQDLVVGPHLTSANALHAPEPRRYPARRVAPGLGRVECVCTCQALGAAADECSMNVFHLCRKKPFLLTPGFRGGDTRCTNGVGCKRSASSSGGSAGASLRSGAAVAGGHGTLPMSSTGSV
jgi:hypothetical protein